MTNTALDDAHYKFRGITFLCDSKTIQILNNALALNGFEERYKLVKHTQKNEKTKQKTKNAH